MQLSFFSPDISLRPHALRFKETSLGKLRASLPIKELAMLLPSDKEGIGRKSYLNNEGKIALQFLKMYIGCSDEDLLERLNMDWGCQLFCGIYLKENESIKDKDLIWKTRALVAAHLDIEKFQTILIKHWKADMKQTQVGLSDATCYESYIKYPTDVNLLWDSVKWLHSSIKYYAKVLGVARPKSKYKEQATKQLAFMKRRKKPKKLERRRRKQLLYLCDKLLLQFDGLLAIWQDQIQEERQCEQSRFSRSVQSLFSQDDLRKYQVIGKIYEQQRFHLAQPEESIRKRIVSLHKPYLRPIVRGKESMNGKRVEFGAKVNTWQVDGINFIEHLSFEAFHEGNRLKQGIAFHHKHFGKVRQVGADQIYATNENRRHCKALNIATNFKPKGRRTADGTIRKQEDQVRSAIGRARATVLEGSYGNDKNHYGLDKVKARSEATEIALIFFGMMTANAVKIAARKEQTLKQSKVELNQLVLAPLARAA